MNESKEDIWEDETWENGTCEKVLWKIDLDWKGAVWTVVGDGGTTYVDKEIVASICGNEDETPIDGKVENDKSGSGTVWGKSIINQTGELLVAYSGDRAESECVLVMEISEI